MNTTPDGLIAIDDLLFGSTQVIPHDVLNWDIDERHDGDDGESPELQWTEAFDYVDASGTTWKLLNMNGRVGAIVYNGHTYDSGAYWDFEADWIEDNPDTADDVISGRDFDNLFDIDPAEHGSEGPQMNYWSECHVADDDSAIKLIDLPLCVVYVDGTPGLALTGGGQDLSWEIIEAYCRLGQMPPVHYARDLPLMAGRGQSAKDRYLVDASVRAMTETIRSLTYDRDKLVERFADAS